MDNSIQEKQSHKFIYDISSTGFWYLGDACWFSREVGGTGVAGVSGRLKNEESCAEGVSGPGVLGPADCG